MKKIIIGLFIMVIVLVGCSSSYVPQNTINYSTTHPTNRTINNSGMIVPVVIWYWILTKVKRNQNIKINRIGITINVMPFVIK